MSTTTTTTAKRSRKCSTSNETSNSKKKRRVLLDEDAEKIIKEEERQEFFKVLQDQYSQIDIAQIGPIPECQRDETMSLSNDNSFQYWMSIMLQYQSFRSFQHYTPDQEEQQKQLEWQKEMRFQLMQKKRAIKREKRRMFKLKSSWDNNKRKSPDSVDSDRIEPSTKRIKLNEQDEVSQIDAYMLSNEDSTDSFDDMGDFIDTLPTPLKLHDNTTVNYFTSSTTTTSDILNVNSLFLSPIHTQPSVNYFATASLV